MSRRLIEATLVECGGEKRKAAEMLGISLKTLYNRLTAYHAEDAAKAGGGNRPRSWSADGGGGGGRTASLRP